MKFSVKVMLKPEILDTQGKALQQQLQGTQKGGVQGGDQGVHKITQCRVGKLIHLEVEGTSPEEAKSQVEKWAKEWFHNPLMETFEIFCENPASPPNQKEREKKRKQIVYGKSGRFSLSGKQLR